MNFADLFRVTLPETALEIAALVVLAVDLGILRRAALAARVSAAALVGILGCWMALLAVPHHTQGALLFAGTHEVLLSTGGTAAIAQAGILALTVLTLCLLVGATFTRNPGEFVAVLLMSAAGGMLIAAAQDLLVIFIGLELLSLGLYILAAFAKKSAASAEAAVKYYLFGGMSAAFLLFGFSYLYGLTGSTSLHQIMRALYGANAVHATALLDLALVMIVAGLGFKVAAVPFHLWAPDAYEGAPAPAAAFIASVSKVASFALLISIGTAAVHVFDYGEVNPRGILATAPGLHPIFIGFAGPWSVALLALAIASMILGNLAALAQRSVRRLLAYSAIAHAGYILLALAFYSRTEASADAVLYYILTYGLTTVGAFGVVAVVERDTGSDQVDAFVGLSRRNPLLAAVLLVLLLSLAGIPPLVGFWAKFNLFAAVLGVSKSPLSFAVVALAVGMSAVSLYYYLQVLKRAYVTPGPESRIAAPPITVAVLVLVAVSVVVLGCFPALVQNWMASFYPSL